MNIFCRVQRAKSSRGLTLIYRVAARFLCAAHGRRGTIERGGERGVTRPSTYMNRPVLLFGYFKSNEYDATGLIFPFLRYCSSVSSFFVFRQSSAATAHYCECGICFGLKRLSTQNRHTVRAFPAADVSECTSAFCQAASSLYLYIHADSRAYGERFSNMKTKKKYFFSSCVGDELPKFSAFSREQNVENVRTKRARPSLYLGGLYGHSKFIYQYGITLVYLYTFKTSLISI